MLVRFTVSWNICAQSEVLIIYHTSGPDSSVGIATELRDGRSVDRIPVRAKFSAPVQTGPGAHRASCTMGNRVYPVGKERPARDPATSSLLVPWSRKNRAIPLLPLWVIRPVHILSACTRVHFTPNSLTPVTFERKVTKEVSILT